MCLGTEIECIPHSGKLTGYVVQHKVKCGTSIGYAGLFYGILQFHMIGEKVKASSNTNGGFHVFVFRAGAELYLDELIRSDPNMGPFALLEAECKGIFKEGVMSVLGDLVPAFRCKYRTLVKELRVEDPGWPWT